jgi:hypothetical protein
MIFHSLSAAAPDVVAHLAAQLGFPCALIWKRGNGGTTELILRDRGDCRRLYNDVPEEVQNNAGNEWEIKLAVAA